MLLFARVCAAHPARRLHTVTWLTRRRTRNSIPCVALSLCRISICLVESMPARREFVLTGGILKQCNVSVLCVVLALPSCFGSRANTCSSTHVCMRLCMCVYMCYSELATPARLAGNSEPVRCALYESHPRIRRRSWGIHDTHA